ncbi:PREDICTED: negative elongation factor B, partial [Myotis davidii]|uniref:negative elongation factor B n=1 Tax=Myotis davidii TaxID=225400 RepID=UPI000767819D
HPRRCLRLLGGASGGLARRGRPCAFCVAPSEQNRPRAHPLLPQTENGVLLPSLQSALPFLDLHRTPRLEFHQSVLEELREKLLERVSAIAAEGKAEERYKKLEDLLEKSFSLVKMPSLQPVVMCVMKHLPKVPEKKLKLVMADKELYRACAVEVKRQIWQDNQALFGDEVSPLLKQYILEKERALFSSELSVLHNFFSPSPRTRRQGEVVLVQKQMVGKNVKLYDMVLQFLRTLFLRTRNVHYCTLRAELLMSLHDLDVGDICSVDPCHKFTWCLDACIRERFVDSKRARELQGFLDGVKKGQEQVLGDLSMILCDPFAISTLSLSTVRHLQELVGQETLPRDSPDLLLLLRLLALGQGAWDMIDSQVFKEPRMEVELITKFLPTLMSFVVDDYAFNVDQKLPAEERAPAAYPSALPESFTRFLQEQRMACEVGLYYVLHITKQRNKNALLRLLPGLVETFSDLAFGDIFLHLLTGNLALLAEEFALEDFCSSLFDGFLLTAS